MTRDELILSCDRLVHKLANKYARRSGKDAEDLASIGYIALIKAADRFDPIGSASFATFAFAAIEGSLKTELAEGGLIYTPYSRKGERQETTEAKQAVRRVASMDAPKQGAEDDGPALQIAGDDARPDSILMEREADAIRNKALGLLLDRDRRMLLMRLDGAKGHEIASEIGVSKNRVHQLLDRITARTKSLVESLSGVPRHVDHPVRGKLPYGHARYLRDLFTDARDQTTWVKFAASLGLPVTTIRSAAARMGLEKPRTVRFADVKEKVLALHHQGWGTFYIAKEVGCHDETIRSNLRKLGLASNVRNDLWKKRRWETWKRNTGKANPGQLRGRTMAQRAAALGHPEVPLGAALVLTALKSGPGDRDIIGQAMGDIARANGWTGTPKGWQQALRWAKWCRDRGLIIEIGGGNKRRTYQLSCSIN